MIIKKAVITAAGQDQRKLPLQTLIDRDGVQRSVLEILVREALDAGIEEVCIVVHPGDENAYAGVLGEEVRKVHFIPQTAPLGYGHALHCAAPFTGSDAFLHLVGDHLYIRQGETGCARHLVTVAGQEGCAVSAVHPVRESIMPHYGVIGGQRVPGRADLYNIEKVVEKPTPTEAELQLMVPGIRAGHYLCFFGMHVLTPAVMEILGEKSARPVRTARPPSRPPSRNWPGASNTWPWRKKTSGTMWAPATACSRPRWPSPSAAAIANRCSPNCWNFLPPRHWAKA
jgi:UTP--glucose-1-phosphate uridylyltransferase